MVPREETFPVPVVVMTRQRTKGHIGIPYISDSWEHYVTTITTTYCERAPSG